MALLLYNDGMAGNNALTQMWLSGQILPATFGSIHLSIHHGEAYFGSYLSSGTASGESTNMLILPEGEDVNFLWTILSGGDTYVGLYENPTIISSGTPGTFYNRDRRSPKTTDSLLFYDATVSGGVLLSSIYVPGGAGPNANGGQINSDDEWLLKPDVPYVLVAKNITNTTQDIGILVESYSETGVPASVTI